MMRSMREGVHSKIIKIVLFGLLTMAVFGLVLMDVGGFFRGGMGNTNVATVAGSSISSTEFQRHVQRVLSNQGITPTDAYNFGYIDQILDNEIARTVISNATVDQGVLVGDDAVAKQINTMIAPLLQSNPEASKKDILQRVLMNQGISETEFVNAIRHEIANSTLQSAIQAGGALVTRDELVALYQLRNESRSINAIILKNSDMTDIKPADEAVLTVFYDAARARYAKPETRTMTIAVLSEKQVRDTMDISDEELRTEYDRNIAQYRTAEKRVLQQAVLIDQADAEAVKAKMDAGATLKDAVKSHTGKTDAYLGESEFERAGLIENIANGAFGAKVGDVVGPLETPLGWHILVLTKINAPDTTPFEKVKADLKKELLQIRLSDEILATANQIDDRLAAGESLDDIVKSMGLDVTKISAVHNDGSTPDKKDGMTAFDKDRAVILETAFSVEAGETAPVMEISGGRFAAVRVDNVTPLSYTPYEEVKDEIAKGWMDDQRATANRDRAQKLQQAVAGGEKTLEQAAKDLGLSVQTFSNIKAGAEPKAPMSTATLAALFDGVQGETMMAPVDGGFMVGTITAINIPAADKISDQDLRPISDSITRTAGNEFMAVYVQHLEDKYGVKINRRMLDLMFGPESGTVAQ